LRAVLVPLTHDEARTFFVYTRTGEFLPWLGHWDAGNHVLCTALGWLSYEAFGMAAWSLRLANVLAFGLYAAYAYRWGLLLSDRAVRWCLWPALLFTPVLIEFFALYRGYGMAMAFLLMALYPLHQAFGVKRVFASSYQAVSGTGAQAIEELANQAREWAEQARAWDAARLDSTPAVYPHQIAFNVLPHVDSFLDSGYTKEEMKMENEGRKIMHHPGFRASVTCVRVPVFRAHSVAISAEFEKPVTAEAAREVLSRAPGLDVIDDPSHKKYPVPLDIAGRDNCAVGRIRQDCALDNGLAFWVVGDQLLKGAALNAVQIAECL
jgi:hypothetical protein